MNCSCEACLCKLAAWYGKEPAPRYSEADASVDYLSPEALRAEGLAPSPGDPDYGPTDAQLTALDSAIATLDATETLREQSWYHRGFAEGLVYAADYLDDQI